MATKLCCTAEQDHRSESPELPNARPSQLTPANRPLLPKCTGSPGSRFTSARSEDLHELREIFHNAQASDQDRAMSMRALRARFSRPSMHSIRSLHKMTSMRSLIRRKFSKELPEKASGVSSAHTQPKQKSITSIPDTVVKQLKDPNQQLRITKHDLRKDLLSDKKPDEGGYDSDAEVLDDIAKNIGKKLLSKRPSIRSVDWTTTTGSKSTPESSTKGRISAELKRDLYPYSVDKPQAASFSNGFTQVFSTPDLRSSTSGERNRKVRRSHSATSMGLPKPSPISPLRLPSLTNHDSFGMPWSEVMHKSLRLSQFPIPPQHINTEASPTMLNKNDIQKDAHGHHQNQNSDASASSPRTNMSLARPAARIVEIRVQQPTSIASPRPSTSVRGCSREDSPSRKGRGAEGEDDGDNDPRRSVHLYSMRISHHLRSGSLLSWDQLADAPDLPVPPPMYRERTVSDQSRVSVRNRQLARHHRQTSSSGFASTKIPSKWGNVLPQDVDARPDVASSIYSSRPQSPPDSFGGSMVTLSHTGTENQVFSISSSDLRRPRRSASFPTDNEETPKPAKRHGLSGLTTVVGHSIESSLLAVPVPLARKNSVADTKTSKFREEFSPSPPKKKTSQSVSIIKFLNPKRLSGRSQSEANLHPEGSVAAMDDPSDMLAIPADRERGHSRSLTSFQTEQDAMGRNKGANHVWDRALQAYQEEKASLFLPQNKDLAVHASPFRERSGSVSVRRASIEGLDPASRADDGSSTRVSTLCPTLQTPSEEPSEGLYTLVSRRSALVGRDDVSVGQEVATVFERQGDRTDIVGAWGRYPSHTRHDRTASAGKADNVQPRDFALEAAIKFASATDDEDLIDPTERRPSTPLLPGEKKKQKKVGSGRIAKSNSMTFGKTLMKNYAKMFRSQSTEFQRHGRGHRSSIASGGILEHPELELLPHVWTGEVHKGHADAQTLKHEEQSLNNDSSMRATKPKGKLRADDSMATLRPRRNSSAPNLNEMSFRDGAAGVGHASARTPLPLDRDSGTELYRQHSHKVEEMQNPKMERVTSGPQTSTSTSRRSANGYMPIEDYGLIGNMRTCAMVATDGGIDYMCWPYFDSPSVFCRILDKEKGGHFTIGPTGDDSCTTKQQYLPVSNVLQTRYLKEEGVMNVVDFFPRPNDKSWDAKYHANVVASNHTGSVPERPDLKKWLVRRVECMRGKVDVCVEVFPAFNYAQDKHTTEIADMGKSAQGRGLQRVIFRSKDLSLELNATIDCGDAPDGVCPRVVFEESPEPQNLGVGVTANFTLEEGQAVSFILRDAEDHSPDIIETEQVQELQTSTQKYWARWIEQSKYMGRWEEVVTRSLLILKMLTFEPSGAIVAAPTFSLPEDFGGSRNWDYRYSWVRDASFTIYTFLRMGFNNEAEAYISYIFQRVKEAKARQGALPIMMTIWGGTDIPELELPHLEGYRASRPVRIGNGAAFHVQLDIYGELMDGIYLVNRFGRPISYDQWLLVREIADYVCTVWKESDMSIWEVRGKKQNFVYSKMMLWVALDRALRLADKRSFPCPHRAEWYRIRDEMYEEVMDKGYNSDLECFIQSYESSDVLDSAVLIAPLVFFISPTDPRFLKTLDRILKAPEKGGLTSTGLVYRYNHALSDDGVGGQEGAFSMCTFWLVEALTRAGAYDEKYLLQAVTIFENMLSFGNHLHIFSEEIARSGEQLGNTPQAFSHLALISAAFNLDKTLSGRRK